MVRKMRLPENIIIERYRLMQEMIRKRALTDLIREGMKETEIAAEAYYRLYRAGSEEPLVYVNAGSNPRVHSEPLSTVSVENDSVVTITLDGDFFRY